MFRIYDDNGNEVARLNVDREEAEEIRDAWNRSKTAPRWGRPFHLGEEEA